MIVREVGAGDDQRRPLVKGRHQCVCQEVGVFQRRLADHQRHDPHAGAHSLDEGQLVLHRMLILKGGPVERDAGVGSNEGLGNGFVHRDRSQRCLKGTGRPHCDLGRAVAGVGIADDCQDFDRPSRTDVIGAASLLQRPERVARHRPGIGVAGVRYDHGQQPAGERVHPGLAHIGVHGGLQFGRIGRIPPSGTLGLVHVAWLERGGGRGQCGKGGHGQHGRFARGRCRQFSLPCAGSKGGSARRHRQQDQQPNEPAYRSFWRGIRPHSFVPDFLVYR